LKERIAARKREYGDDLLILGHHYQGDDVIEMTDIQGDSLELARRIPGVTARHVVFCGVHFMAETAAILASPGQKVFIPDATAGCVMANMAPAGLVERVMAELSALGGRTIPLAYVNSSAEVKAICGRYGGSVCTSANAVAMLEWALGRGERVLFIPDKNLGTNSAHLLGLSASDVTTLDIRRSAKAIDLSRAGMARVLLWPGVCAVHHLFKTGDVRRLRSSHPGAFVIVHPECSPELVAEADAAGSTSFIIEYVRQAPRGATVFIGTEVNLVNRLRKAYQSEKDVRPLAGVSCSNMAKTDLAALARLLDSLGTASPVVVPEPARGEALQALGRMLGISGAE
jgi:quinolinate synthase